MSINKNMDKYVKVGSGSQWTVWFDKTKREHLFIDESSVLRCKLTIEPFDNTELMINNMFSQYKSFISGEEISSTYTEYVETDSEGNEINKNEESESAESFIDFITPDENKTLVEKERTIITGIDKIDFDKSNITIFVTLSDGNTIPVHGRLQSLGVEKQYRSDTGTVECHECGNTIDVSCKHLLKSEAYCENCGIKYTQEREYLLDDEDRVYYCEDCEGHHDRSVPEEEWKAVEPQIWGREDYGISCFCGNTIRGHNLEVNEPVECRCGRTIKVSLSEK